MLCDILFTVICYNAMTFPLCILRIRKPKNRRAQDSWETPHGPRSSTP